MRAALAFLLLLGAAPLGAESAPRLPDYDRSWEKKQRELHEQKLWEGRRQQQQQWQQQQPQQKILFPQGGSGSTKPAVTAPGMGFTAKLENGRVVLSWKKYKRPDFKFYRLVKTNFNEDPPLPPEALITIFKDAGKTAHEEVNPYPGTWYYRLCVVTDKGERWAGDVAPVFIPGGGTTAAPGPGDFE